MNGQLNQTDHETRCHHHVSAQFSDSSSQLSTCSNFKTTKTNTRVAKNIRNYR